LLILSLESANKYVLQAITLNCLLTYALWIAHLNTNINKIKHVLVIALKLITTQQIYTKTITVIPAKILVFQIGILIMRPGIVNRLAQVPHSLTILLVDVWIHVHKTLIITDIIMFATLFVLLLVGMLKTQPDYVFRFVLTIVLRMISIEDAWMYAPKSNILFHLT
jgi:hypothetical protein